MTIDVPTSLPGRSSVARIPAWNDPSPRKPSLDRHDLTAKQALIFTSSTILGGIASARDDWVSNARVIAVLRPAPHALHGQVRGLLAVAGVAEQFVALGEQRHHRPQLGHAVRPGRG